MKKRLKGLGALVLVFTMVLSMFAMTVQADTPSWDTSWYNGTDTVYTISTPAQFAGLFFLSEPYPAEIKVELAADLDMSGYTWNAPEMNYHITISGKGHVVSNLTGTGLCSLNGHVMKAYNVGFEACSFGQEPLVQKSYQSGETLFLKNAYCVGRWSGNNPSLDNAYVFNFNNNNNTELKMRLMGNLYDAGESYLNGTLPAGDLEGVSGQTLWEDLQDWLSIIEQYENSVYIALKDLVPNKETATIKDYLNFGVAYDALTRSPEEPAHINWYTASNLNHGFPQFKDQQPDSGIPSWIFGCGGIGGNPFADVPADSWFADAVIDMNARGIMTGTAPDTFSSETAVSRAQLVTALWRLEGQPMGVEHAGFPDVDMDSWYGYAVDWAAAFDIVEGYDGLFHSEAPVTREQMAAILYRYTQYVGGDMLGAADLSGYTDAGDISDYAAAAMQWAVAQGLMEGSNFELNPKGTLTRAQMAVILSRYLSK